MSCTQKFTLMNHPPTLTCPPDEFVKCEEDIKVQTPVYSTPCGLYANYTFTGPTLVSGQKECPGAKYEIVYTVTDECGRSVSCTQTFTIQNDDPTIICPPDVTLSHIDDFVPGNPTVTGSCGQHITITGNGPVLVSGNDCDGAVYKYTYTATDECGRSVSCDQYIYTEPKALQCSTYSSNTSCGFSNGSANVTANGGFPPYSYAWSSGETTTSITNKASGTYSVTVTDSKGCTTYCTVNIGPSTSPTCYINGTDTSCGLYNGSATAIASGGTGTYTYLWNTGETTQTISNLVAGTYSVDITDSEGCTTSCSVVIKGSSSPTCSINKTDTSCGFDNGSATVQVTGGQAPYTFLWSTGDNTQTISGLSAGTYSVVVTDAYGCTTNCSVYIQNSSSPTCTIYSTDATCGYPNGSATVNAFGGVGPYTYLWNNGATTQTVNNLDAGTYTVIVTDSEGCTTDCYVTITNTTSPTCSIYATNTTCGLDNGSATVYASGGSGSYTYLWSNGATTPTIDNLPAGNYSVVITDSNGCTTDCSVYIEPSQGISCSITSVDTDCGDNNGSATVSVFGGQAPYTYLWSNGSSSATINNLTAGVYTVVVTDALGCTTNCSVTIGGSTTPVCSATGTDTTCGENNGSASVSVTGGQAPYSYLWSNGATTTTISNLPGGTYSVVVTDANGCKTNCTVFVGQSSMPTCWISSNDTTCGMNNGSATASVTGGQAPFTYLWSNGATTQTTSGLAPGTYSVQITDANGCTTSCSINILPSSNPTCTISSTDTSCGSNNGTATVFASGGQAPYTYLWSTGATTQAVGDLGAGNYSVQVTDALGCVTSCSITIGSSSNITCSITGYDTTCGLNNGSAVATVSGGQAPYTYAWSNGATTSSITDVAAGTYSVVITDAAGCATNCSVTINPSVSPTCTISSTDATCGNSNGTATAQAAGGQAPYTYAWSNGATTQSISNLTAGTYSVVITDSNNCTTTCSVTVGGSSSPACSITGTDTSCGLANGTATVFASGGQAPYTYAWSNGATTQSVSNLAAGNYSVVITDAFGCTTSCSVSIAPSNAPGCTITKTDTYCGLNNGTATAQVSGGDAPYTYAWSTGATTQTVSNLAPGNYSVVVTDSKGCVTNCSVYIKGSSAPTCYITSTNSTCGLPNGTATVTGSGGSGVYTYLWSTGATTQTATNLTAGTYSVVVTDSDGCSTTCSVVVGSADAPSCSISSTDTSCGLDNGSASVFASGGQAPYSYLWSNGATTSSISNLAAGTYTVIITDANGCTTSCTANISGSSKPVCSINSSEATCGEFNGTATALVNGGRAPYTYSWSNGATTQTITNLGPGNYTVVVTDADGCTTACNVIIGLFSGPSCWLSSTDASCGLNNGSATASASGGLPSYTYLWSNGGTTQTITGLAAGTYSVTVTDSNGCTTSCSVDVGDTPMPVCSVASNPASCNLANGSASVTASGGSGGYSYQWSNGATSSVATGLTAGTYSVTVTDSNGCSTTCGVVVSSTSAPTCLISGNDATCGASNGSAQVIVSGGSGGYTYLWSNGETTPVITDLAPGTYTVIVTDSNGCATNCEISIAGGNNPVCSTSSTPTTCGNANGSVSVSVSGGQAPYTYAWNTGDATATVNNLPSGNYSVVITDAAGCSTTCSVVVTSVSEPTCSITSTNASCGLPNGTATVTASGGQAPYTYAWSNGSSSATVTGLSEGTYSVVVTDANGCTTSCSVVVGSSAAPTCSASSTPTSCGSANGSATVIASGGQAPYTYAWSNGGTSQTITAVNAGTYTVIVTDANGCSTTCTVDVGSSNGPSCYASATDATCGDANGTATVTASGGQAPYTYLWSNGATTDVVTGLAGGTYSVTVTDASGCITACSVSVSQMGSPICSISGTDTTCGSSTGTATVTASGGSGTYAYWWSNGETTQTITGLAAGSYTVTVEDINGCISECSINIGSSSSVTCVASGTDATCGDPNGTVNVSASGGVAPYTYQWSNGSTTQNVTGLFGGTYSVTVTDAQGCSSVCQATIASIGGPTCVATSTPSNCDDNNGTAMASANGGTGLYSYLWNTGATTMFIDNLSPGTYTVTVTDGKGCQVVCSVDVAQVMDMCSGELGNKVWDDLNGDGIQDTGEPGIANVDVELYEAETNILVAAQQTNTLGEYCFTDLYEGNYYVKFTKPLGAQYVSYILTDHVENPAAGNCDVTHKNGPNTTNTIFLSQGEINKTIDAGFYQGGTIGNQVWCDNDNGIPHIIEASDELVEGVVVNLYEVDSIGSPSSMVMIDSKITNANGSYYFNKLSTGYYVVEFEAPIDKAFVSPKIGFDDEVDSDVVSIVSGPNVFPQIGRTYVINLAAGEERLTIDAGLTNDTNVPIELLDFSGRWIEERGANELLWITSMEVNSDYFAVERTMNVNDGFREIGTVEAAGNSAEELAYTYDDYEIYESGVYYYRLRQVDLDGKYEYSKVIAIEVEMDGELEQEVSLGVYPNPAHTMINVDVTVKKGANFEGGFYDAIGQLVKKIDTRDLDPGKTSMQIDIDDLPVGTYLLRVQVDDQVIFEKVAKAN